MKDDTSQAVDQDSGNGEQRSQSATGRVDKDNSLKAARDAFRNSVGFQFSFVLHSGLEVEKAIDHICSAADRLLAAVFGGTRESESSEASHNPELSQGSPASKPDSDLVHPVDSAPETEELLEVTLETALRCACGHFHRDDGSCFCGCDEFEPWQDGTPLPVQSVDDEKVRAIRERWANFTNFRQDPAITSARRMADIETLLSAVSGLQERIKELEAQVDAMSWRK